MKRRVPVRWAMAIRIGLAVGAVCGVAILRPVWWIRSIAPVMAPVIDVFTPWVEAVTVRSEGTMLHIEGQMRLGVTRYEGGPLRGPPAQWSREGTSYLILLVVAVSAWAIPPGSWKRRLPALPVTLLLVAWITAAQVTIELQETGLRSLGGGALQHIPLADTEENRAILQSFERRYQRVLWVKAFSDAGGRLFLSVLAGLVVVALPARRAGLTGASATDLSGAAL